MPKERGGRTLRPFNSMSSEESLRYVPAIYSDRHPRMIQQPAHILCVTLNKTSTNTCSISQATRPFGNLAKVNPNDAPIGRCSGAAWKNSACSVDSQQHFVAGLAKLTPIWASQTADSSCKCPSSIGQCAGCHSPLPRRSFVNPLL